MRKVFSKSIVLILAFLPFSQVLAQTGANSPYSRIGIGDLINQAFFTNQSMGSLNASFADPFQANVLNPASLATLQNTAFEIGIDAFRSGMTLEGEKASFWNGGMKYLSLSFPLINPVNRNLDRRSDDFSWGMNIGLLPFSTVDYDNEVEQDLPDVGGTVRQFRGSGGISRLNLGNGLKYKNFYAGFNLSYLFGSVNDEQALLYDEFSIPWSPYELREDSYRGFLYNLGLQYRLDINTEEKEHVQFGLIFNGSTNYELKTQTDLFRIRQDPAYFGLGSNLQTLFVDTLSTSVQSKTGGKLPGQLRLGATYHKDNLQLGIDFALEGWSNFEDDRGDVPYDDTWRLAAGIAYTPDPTSFNNYLKRITYRGGVYTGPDPRVIESNQIRNLGVTAGASLPFYLGRQASFINLGVQYENQTADNAITTSTVRFNLGITLNNNLWFYKRKYN